MDYKIDRIFHGPLILTVPELLLTKFRSDSHDVHSRYYPQLILLASANILDPDYTRKIVFC